MRNKKVLCLLSTLSILAAGCSSPSTTSTSNPTSVPTSSVPTSSQSTSEATSEDMNVYELSCEDITLCTYKEELKEREIKPVLKVNNVETQFENYIFESLNNEVAKINGNKVIGVKKGQTKIKISAEIGQKIIRTEIKVEVIEEVSSAKVNSFDEEAISLFGRVYFQGESVLVLDCGLTGFEIMFYGTSLTATISGTSKNLYYHKFIDQDATGEFIQIKSNRATATKLAEGLEEGLHCLRLVKSSSPQNGTISFSEFKTDGAFISPKAKSDLKIEFIGDSITVGFGNLGNSSTPQSPANSDAAQAFPYFVAAKYNADFNETALEGICVKDGSVNSTNTYLRYSPCNNSKEYDPSTFDADFVVIGLGENDMWHATDAQFSYTIEQFKEDYKDFLLLVREKHPLANIICIHGMMPASATAQAKEVIQSAIDETNDKKITHLVATPNTIGSNGHPNVKAHKSYANKITAAIDEILGE